MLTGDRITGRLHLGHYAGSLQNRAALQKKYESYVLLADVQALTTHFDQPGRIAGHLREVALDYLAAGIDPDHTQFVVQSLIPEIAELTVFFSMFVTVNSLRHNPTVKAESEGAGLDQLYYGFLGYPVSQAADITVFKATVIPVGDDQLPHIEQTRKIVRRFNDLYRPVLKEPEALISPVPRLPGLDGRHKMSKSKGNAIVLDASPEETAKAIQKAVTDPSRIRKNDPGHPGLCPIYAYHKAFREEGAEEIRVSCSSGTIGCAECKSLAAARISEITGPMRERRRTFEARPKQVDEILLSGTSRARSIARETMKEVRDAMGIAYFPEHAR
jgi:tryptophanyl-tRNA synthetase